MSFEPWWFLIIPLLFALGWIAARVDLRQMHAEQRNLPDSYFKGLNFLLNDQSDRAIDAFIEVAKLNTETIELHFALGNLFRRRGELERAIRVHQNLLQREDLPINQREQALHELAQDYLRAGMFDRAEQSYHDLLHSPYAADALRALVRIYEAERDWIKAIKAALDLQKTINEPVAQIAHFYCEQALQAMHPVAVCVHDAKQALRQAQSSIDGWMSSPKPTSLPDVQVRVWLLSAQLAGLDNDKIQQKYFLDLVLERAPNYAGLVAQEWLTLLDPEGQAEGLTELVNVYALSPSLDLFQVIFLNMFELYGYDKTWSFVRQGLVSQPSLLSLEAWITTQINYYSEQVAPSVSLEDMELVRSLLHKHTQRVDRYACRACGFKAKKFHWQCPGCNTWETYLPRRLEELDS